MTTEPLQPFQNATGAPNFLPTIQNAPSLQPHLHDADRYFQNQHNTPEGQSLYSPRTRRELHGYSDIPPHTSSYRAGGEHSNTALSRRQVRTYYLPSGAPSEGPPAPQSFPGPAGSDPEHQQDPRPTQPYQYDPSDISRMVDGLHVSRMEQAITAQSIDDVYAGEDEVELKNNELSEDQKEPNRLAGFYE